MSENPPAFPNFMEGYGPYQEGMSLRDYFASQVDIEAYFPFSTLVDKNDDKPSVAEMAAWIAEVRYLEADAMLAQREKSGA